MEMQKKYPHCYSHLIDLGDVWVFRLEYKNQYWETESASFLYIRRETLEVIHSEELTYLKIGLRNNYFAPHFKPFYHVEIENKM